MGKDCAIYRTANFIGKRWTLLILLELYKGKNKWKRFSELKRKISPITQKILSARLRELEKEGLIKKKVSRFEFPIRSEYKLSLKGDKFINVIKEMKRWYLECKARNKNCEGCECAACLL